MNIAGWFALFFGLVWLIWPQVLRWQLVGKASWALYWLFLAYLYVPVSTLVAPYGWRGWLGLAIGLVIFGGLLRSAIGALAAKAPLVAFRAIGLLNLAGGIYLVWFRK